MKIAALLLSPILRSLILPSLICLSLICLSLIALPARADDVPPERQAMILARVLSYDSAEAARERDGLLALVLHGPDDAAAAQTMARAFSVRVGDVTISAHASAYSTPTALASLLADKKVDVIYLTPGVDAHVTTISQLAAKLSLPVFSGRRSHVDLGAAVSVTADVNKPRLTIHLEHSKRQGMRLSGNVLGLADVIR